MRFEFQLPDIGEGIVEGEIVKWLVKPGDAVAEDQPLVEVMTDKATVTIPSPRRGRVLETCGKEGEKVQVHKNLIVLEVADGGAEAASHPQLRAVSGDDRPTPVLAAPGPGTPSMQTHPPPSASAAPSATSRGGRVLAAPATRRLARELGVDLASIPATGEGGRVTKEDVRRFAEHGGGAPAAGAPALHLVTADERIPFRGIRKRIAEKMAKSRRTAAHFTFVEECDMGQLLSLRNAARAQAEAAGYKLTFLPFIVKAVVAALKKHPMLNATLDEERGEIVLKKGYHIGIAAATDEGLIVPVVKDADRKTIRDIAVEIDRLSRAAREGRAQLADLTGSTFTITSLGAQGGLFATPIINFPEVAILGIHQIKKRPVVQNGVIAVGDVMLLSLSFDHRIVDGHVGAAFAYDLIRLLENPALLFADL